MVTSTPSRRPLLLIPTLLLLLALGFWGWQQAAGTRGASTPDPSPDAGPELLAQGSEQPDPSALPPGADPQETDQRRALRDGDRRPLIRVRVVDGLNGSGVADASLLYPHPDVRDQTLLRRLTTERPKDAEHVFARVGGIARTDANGWAEIPRPTLRAVLLARKDQRYGEAWFSIFDPPPVSGYTIKIFPDHHLQARVIDHRGDPVAGIPVQLQRAVPQQKNPRALTWIHGSQLNTDDQGRCRFYHAQVQFGMNPDVWRIRLLLEIPGWRQASSEWTHSQLPTVRDEIVLQLPPTGSMSVAVVDGSGNTQPLSTRFQLRNDGPKTKVLKRGSLSHGRLQLPRLPLGRHFALLLEGKNWQLRHSLNGPREAGESVHHDLRPPAEHRLLWGQITDEHGSLLRRTPLHLRLHRRSDTEYRSLASDSEGRFLVCAPPAWGSELESLHLVTQERGADAPPMREIRIAELSAGDLGTLKLQPIPLLAAGRITIDGVGTRPAGNLLFFAKTATDWLRFYPAGFRWERNGGYRVYGSTSANEVRLDLQSNGYLPIPSRHFAPGTTGVDLELSIAALPRLRIRYDPTWRNRDTEPLFQACLIATDDPKPVVRTRRQYRLDERFAIPWGPADRQTTRLQWLGMKPGRYTLQIYQPGIEALVQQIPGVELRAGPHDLAELDLRPLLHACCLDIVDTQTKTALPRALLRLHGPTPGALPAGRIVRGGRHTLLHSGAGTQISVHAPGYRSWTGHASTGTLRVALQPLPQRLHDLRLSPTLPPALAGGPAQIRCQVAADTDTGPTYFLDGNVPRTLRAPGLKQLPPRQAPLRNGRRTQLHLTEGPRWTFTLVLPQGSLALQARPAGEQAGQRRIALSYDPADLQKLLAEKR